MKVPSGDGTGRTRRLAREADERERSDEPRRAREAAQNTARHDALVNELRRGYFRADPTATEAAFQAALPDLLEQRRRAAALAGDDNPADAAARAAFRSQYRG